MTGAEHTRAAKARPMRAQNRPQRRGVAARQADIKGQAPAARARFGEIQRWVSCAGPVADRPVFHDRIDMRLITALREPFGRASTPQACTDASARQRFTDDHVTASPDDAIAGFANTGVRP